MLKLSATLSQVTKFATSFARGSKKKLEKIDFDRQAGARLRRFEMLTKPLPLPFSLITQITCRREGITLIRGHTLANRISLLRLRKEPVAIFFGHLSCHRLDFGYLRRSQTTPPSFSASAANRSW